MKMCLSDGLVALTVPTECQKCQSSSRGKRERGNQKTADSLFPGVLETHALDMFTKETVHNGQTWTCHFMPCLVAVVDGDVDLEVETNVAASRHPVVGWVVTCRVQWCCQSGTLVITNQYLAG